MDLRCYEEGFPPSDDEDGETEQSIHTAVNEGVKAASDVLSWTVRSCLDMAVSLVNFTGITLE